jgi:hypothetical protein
MNFLIKNKDKTQIRLSTKPDGFDWFRLSCVFYDKDGIYSALNSWADLSTTDELKRQLASVVANGSEVYQILPTGKILDYKIIAL